MFGLAQPTPYDLRFRLLDIPVRVHPLFWLIMALLSGGNNNLVSILIFIACGFVSILVHEYGHGLTARLFGSEPHEIVLYAMGGYCLADFERLTPRERFAGLIAGPGAGFLLLGLVFVVGRVFAGIPFTDDFEIVQMLLGFEPGHGLSPGFFQLSPVLRTVYTELCFINLMWGLLNLLPILPLDGGRILEVLLSMHDRRHALRRTLIVSLLTSGMLGVVCLQRKQIVNALLLFSLAFTSYQNLQTLHHSHRSESYDDADWWKR